MAQSFQLTVKAGPNPGKVYEFDQDEVVVGRDLGNDIVVSDADISRRHAHLVRQGDAYLVEDLGSTNGTYVNGTRLSGPQLLEGGESILFGSSVEMEYAPVAYDVNATVITPPPAVEPAVVEPALAEPAMVEPAVVVPAVIEAPAPQMDFPPVPEPAYQEVPAVEPAVEPAFGSAFEPEAPVAEPAYSTPAPVYEPAALEAAPKSNKGLWIGLAVGCFVLACVCIVVVVGAVLVQSGAFNSF